MPGCVAHDERAAGGYLKGTCLFGRASLERVSLRTIGGTLLAAAAATAAVAQTTDPLYRSWEWVDQPSSVRAAALGGAVAAGASDAMSGAFSPAWLSLASEVDVRLSVGWNGEGLIASDRVNSGWTLAGGAVALPLGLNKGIAVYYRSPRSLDMTIQAALLPEGWTDEGRLGATVREAGVAFGAALTPRLRVGLRVGAAHLDLDGQATTLGPGDLRRVSASRADTWEPSAGVGLLFAVNQRFFASLNWDRRMLWNAERAGGAPPAAHDLVAPSRLAGGLLFRPSSVVWITGQLDWMRWSQVSSALVSPDDRPPKTDFALDDALDGRIGLELRAEYGESLLWKRLMLRFGLHYRSRGLLEYTGADPVDQERFGGGSHRTEWSLGAAFGPLEVAWIGREPSSVWVFGVRQSF